MGCKRICLHRKLPRSRSDSRYIDQASSKSKTQETCVRNGFIAGLKGSVEMDGTTTRHMGKRLSKISNVLGQLILYVGYKVAVSYKEPPRVRRKGQSVPLTPTPCAP